MGGIGRGSWRGGGWVGRHQGEYCVEGEGADEGEAIDVAEVDFSAEEEEGGEEEAEEDGAGEVGVVHYVLGYWVQGVEYCEGLFKIRTWLAKISKAVSRLRAMYVFLIPSRRYC